MLEIDSAASGGSSAWTSTVSFTVLFIIYTFLANTLDSEKKITQHQALVNTISKVY